MSENISTNKREMTTEKTKPLPKSNEISTAYNSKEIEEKIYEFWAENGYFNSKPDESKQPYVILMPPPNITGTLHLGHALDGTIQDILIRWKRMKGYNVCWIPGTDHASIATEAKLVAELAKDGKSKYEVGRDEFLKKAWEWRNLYGGAIVEQQKKLGASPDWSRSRFTMDEICSRAVRWAFVELFSEGLIYRGNRMVNWCTNCNTSISDVEVEHEENAGHLWHIAYPFKDGSGQIVVTTTRPETMLGDVAVAVNPQDDRYAKAVGKTLILPIMNREIPVVADDYVDMGFGSGCVKVTPAHDPNDFEIGLRHDLEVISVIGQDGKMTKEAGKFAGMDRFEARAEVVKELLALGALLKTEDHLHSVGHCQRCGSVPEPLVSDQWFVKMSQLAGKAAKTVKEGKIRFVPERFEKTYMSWMENCKDWCISRQLWWGHRIPIWYCKNCGEIFASIEEATKCTKCHSNDIYQDNDVLDTWFSSGIWPFSTLGWPDETPELKHWYPSAVLVTGYDIIFFWVARMIFMSLKFMNEVPFKDVLLHGLIRNADGSKMSRSKGTGINPLDLINEYGADTLRFTVITGNTPGNDIRWNPDKVEASRNFCNKIWNASRFVMMNLEGFDPFSFKEKNLALQTADRWIISKFHKTISEVDAALERYDFGEASRSIYEFIWGEYCDWYIEIVKPRLYGKEDESSKKTAQYVLWKVLDGALKLLHPFMPFITEGIWQHLPKEGDSLMMSSWPIFDDLEIDEEAESKMAFVMEVVRAVRNIRAEYQVLPSKKVDAIVLVDGEASKLMNLEMKTISNLAGINSLNIMVSSSERPQKACVAVVSDAEIFLPLAGLIDVNKEVERISKELDKMKAELASVESKLSNEAFVGKAPEAIVNREKDKVKDLNDSITKLTKRLEELVD